MRTNLSNLQRKITFITGGEISNILKTTEKVNLKYPKLKKRKNWVKKSFEV